MEKRLTSINPKPACKGRKIGSRTISKRDLAD
jgi:hypothetical protein